MEKWRVLSFKPSKYGLYQLYPLKTKETWVCMLVSNILGMFFRGSRSTIPTPFPCPGGGSLALEALLGEKPSSLQPRRIAGNHIGAGIKLVCFIFILIHYNMLYITYLILYYMYIRMFTHHILCIFLRIVLRRGFPQTNPT